VTHENIQTAYKEQFTEQKRMKGIRLQKPGNNFKEQSYSLWQHMLQACASYHWNKNLLGS
jgi:hypothetical protein